jgi:hypothetical protein
MFPRIFRDHRCEVDDIPHASSADPSCVYRFESRRTRRRFHRFVVAKSIY